MGYLQWLVLVSGLVSQMGLRDRCSVFGVVFRAMFGAVFCGVLIYDI